MAVYTPNKGYAQPGVAGDNNVWGTLLDTNWSTLDDNLGGVATVNCAGNTDVTPTSAQAQNLVQQLTGALTGSINYILPPVGSLYIVENATTGGFPITIITSAGGSIGVVAPQGTSIGVWSDGTNVSSMTPGIYLTLVTAAATYLSIANAASTYLTQGNAATTYLTQTVANTTYLKKADAAAEYLTLTGGTVSGALTVNAPVFGVSTGAAAAYTAQTPSVGDPLMNFWFLSSANVVGSVTTSGSGVSYNTTSDARLKVDDGEISAQRAGSIVDRLRPKWFHWKSGDGSARPGFFAQQVAKVFPWAVTKGRGRPGGKSFQPWQMDASALMPVVIAELKALRARVKELEGA